MTQSTERPTVKRPLDTHGARYGMFYLKKALRGMTRRHRLRFEPIPSHEDLFHYSEEDRRMWREMFQVGDDKLYIPYTCYDASRAVHLLRFLDIMHVNLLSLLHLKSSMVFHKRAFMSTGTEEFKIVYEPEDLSYVNRNRAALFGKTFIYDSTGDLVTEILDYFLIQNIRPADLEHVKKRPPVRQDEIAEIAEISKREPVLAGLKHRSEELVFPEDLGYRYSRLSGDRNPIHLSRLFARMAGYRRTFAQGLCSANMIMKTIVLAEKRELARFSVAFRRPVFFRDTVTLRWANGAFEVTDEKGKLLIYGNYQLKQG